MKKVPPPSRRAGLADARFTRAASERMKLIHERIQSGGFPSSARLAAECEVSHKTVQRDIAFMKGRLQLPIAYDPRRFGFYYTRSVEGLPGLSISEAELLALLVAHKAIAQYRGTPFEQPLRLAFQKLTGQCDPHQRYSLQHLGEALSFRPFAPEDTDLQVFECVTRALHQGRALRFRYRNLGARSARERRVHPYHLACIDNHWYLFAYDLERKAIRTFALGRLSRPGLTEERFCRPKEFDPDEYLRGSFSVLDGKDDYAVLLEFDAWATDLVRGRHWHASQELTELPGGGSRLRLRLSSLEEIERWVLSWGTHALVIRPQVLAERIRERAEGLANRYRGS